MSNGLLSSHKSIQDGKKPTKKKTATKQMRSAKPT